MTISWNDFFQELIHNGILRITVLLMMTVILINGWTDAPNAIASSIGTRALKPKTALFIATIFNFLGVLFMSLINTTVAQTIYLMVDFQGDARLALAVLCAAMISIVLWSIMAWSFGIPTSESHALIAGISGAAIAFQNGFKGINGSEWVKVLYGLVFSSLIGFVLGYLLVKLIGFFFKNTNYLNMRHLFKRGQAITNATMAFMHGAQDGQKFIGVFMLGIFLSKGLTNNFFFHIPLWLMVLCSAIMAIGTSIGGYKIIKSIGIDMVRLSSYQAFASDLASTSLLLTSSLMGIPVSTTHMKTMSLMGSALAQRKSSINWQVVNDIIWTWLLTFPGCGLIGFLIAKVFIIIA